VTRSARYNRNLGAGIAQLVVHLICNQGVGGSSPSAGTKIPFKIRQLQTNNQLLENLSYQVTFFCRDHFSTSTTNEVLYHPGQSKFEGRLGADGPNRRELPHVRRDTTGLVGVLGDWSSG
jgi:hypothetical protein